MLGQPALASDIDLTTARDETTSASGQLGIDSDGTVHGLAVWFDSLLCAGVTVDNYPTRTDSSWSLGFLPLAEPIDVAAGNQLVYELFVSSDGQDWVWHIERTESE